MADSRFSKVVNHKGYRATDACSLDGRYFNLVLAGMPGVEPLPIEIEMHDTKTMLKVPALNWEDPLLNICRVVLITPRFRHCLVMFVNKSAQTVELWDPVEAESYDDYSESLKDIARQQLVPPSYELYYSRAHFKPDYPSKCMTGARGYCNAYVLHECVCRLTGNTSDHAKDIRSFITAVEENYSKDLTGAPDIEYGLGFGLGLAGGLVAGTAIGAGGYGYGYPAYGYPAYGYGYGGYGGGRRYSDERRRRYSDERRRR
jgi:hypothetical protein